MKKRLMVVGVLVLLTIFFVNVQSIYSYIKDVTTVMSIKRNLKYGKIGKDTVVCLGDGKFRIDNIAGTKELTMYDETGQFEIILYRVEVYKIKRGVLYVLGNQGYGIVDYKTNRCRLFVEKYTDGQKIISDKIIKDKDIEYLLSYDDFTEEERKIFSKLEEKDPTPKENPTDAVHFLTVFS